MLSKAEHLKEKRMSDSDLIKRLRSIPWSVGNLAADRIEELEQWQRMIMLKMQGETAHEFYESSGDKPPDSL